MEEEKKPLAPADTGGEVVATRPASAGAGQEGPSKIDDGKATLHVFETCPNDKTHVKILLQSGQKTDFYVNASDTVDQFCNFVFERWPIEWINDKTIVNPVGGDKLKMLHRGKFPERSTTLESNGLTNGVTTTVHILVKNDATNTAVTSTEAAKSNEQQSGCRCIIL
ncbi:hypothetical protein BC833DRAFT_588310 [Globomyces pollinis-pini]|nr:hypothetical protein BC833DRAFT_588310 [Globomyces pollinis-pini]